MTTLLLVHGGLWEEGMDADHFWGQPGIVAGLEKRGFGVLAPDRRHQAPDWIAEASHLAAVLPRWPATVECRTRHGRSTPPEHSRQDRAARRVPLTYDRIAAYFQVTSLMQRPRSRPAG
jgi:hypothetical protein